MGCVAAHWKGRHEGSLLSKGSLEKSATEIVIDVVEVSIVCHMKITACLIAYLVWWGLQGLLIGTEQSLFEQN